MPAGVSGDDLVGTINGLLNSHASHIVTHINKCFQQQQQALHHVIQQTTLEQALSIATMPDRPQQRSAVKSDGSYSLTVPLLSDVAGEAKCSDVSPGKEKKQMVHQSSVKLGAENRMASLFPKVDDLKDSVLESLRS